VGLWIPLTLRVLGSKEAVIVGGPVTDFRDDRIPQTGTACRSHP
jgi:hypothetical protein